MSEPTSSPPWLNDYQALTTRAGFVPLERTQIEITGKDRASWLHNLCTNEIKKLAPGSGCEAFITTVQGKTLGHGLIFVGPEAIVLDTVAGQAETLIKHLDRYLICEQVELKGRSAEWTELLLAGPEAESLLARLWQVELPPANLSHGAIDGNGISLSIRRANLVPHGFLISAPASQSAQVREQLQLAGAVPCDVAAFEAARIEAGTPLFGQDISDKNLPQELARDAQAISFVKGCYLGQETVARIDALGHVNRLLVGLRFSGGLPATGDELRGGDQVVGNVTSASYSPRLSAGIALGYVRSAQAKPGTRLESTAGDAEVIALPVA